MNRPLKFIVPFLAVMLLFQACQDDPILEKTVNGVPVITPKSRAYITAVQLNSFPSQDPNGNTWDAIDLPAYDTLGAPDIFFNIATTDAQPAILWSQNSHFSNTRQTDTIPYYLLAPFEITPFDSYINVNLYDYELPDSTLMGTVNFFIGTYPDPLNPYPSSITSNQNGVSITLGLSYK